MYNLQCFFVKFCFNTPGFIRPYSDFRSGRNLSILLQLFVRMKEKNEGKVRR